MDKKKILLFGGTFNPVHNGHLVVSRFMAEKLGADKVCIIPNGDPPHKNGTVPKEHRYAMLKAAVTTNDLFSNDFFDISRYEIEKKKPSYTLETIRYFKSILPKIDKPYWLIGPDNLEDLKNWYKINELIQECIFVVGISALTTDVFQKIKELQLTTDILVETVIIPHLDIRSTHIRERIEKGLPIRHYVPDAVADYIEEHELYKINKQRKAV